MFRVSHKDIIRTKEKIKSESKNTKAGVSYIEKAKQTKSAIYIWQSPHKRFSVKPTE